MNPLVRLVGVGVLVVGLFAGSLAAMACQPPNDDVGPRDCGETSARCDGQGG